MDNVYLTHCPMKKTSKKSLRRQQTSGTGIALLICFVIATVGVAVAIRQLVLERRYLRDSTLVTTAPKPTTTTLAGHFVSQLSDRTVELELKADRTASINHDHTNNKLDFKENGSWSGDTNGTIIVSIGDKTTYAFSAQKDTLTLLNPDIKIWGSNKVIFSKK